MSAGTKAIARRTFLALAASGLTRHVRLAGGTLVHVTFDPARASLAFGDGVALGALEAERITHLLGTGVRIVAPQRSAHAAHLSWEDDAAGTGALLMAERDGSTCRFRTAAAPIDRVQRLARWLLKSRHDRRVQLLFDPALAGAAHEAAPRLGAEGLRIVSLRDSTQPLDDRTTTAILLSRRPDDADSLRRQGLRGSILRACEPSVGAVPSQDDYWVADWHPSFDRYGAADVNERFTRQFHRPMTSDAWHGWVAVKAFTEAVVRGDPAALCHALETLRFDGHKGALLTFDAQGRLEQPLLLMKGEASIVEVI